MPAISPQAARSRLAPYHDRIFSVVDLAWEEYWRVVRFKASDGIGAVVYRRTVANDVFDNIVRHVAIEFGSDPLISVKFEAQTIKLFFGGFVVGRFKRGRRDYRLGRNIQTQAVLDFVDPDGWLQGFPPETAKVEFVWITNDVQTQIDHLLVVARNGNKLLWEYEIERPAAATSGTVVPFPNRGPEAGGTGEDDLVRPKLPAAPKTKEDE